MTAKTSIVITGLIVSLVLQTQAASRKIIDWGLTGVPTPLEEYGLSLGDITVSRVFNPTGQLTTEDSVVIARRLTKITNPWQELTPGTGLIVDGKKAVIRQIQPNSAPSSKETGLRIRLVVEEISGTTMTLDWEQVLLDLNKAETGPARESTVDLLKNNLRVGLHLIINGSRKIISKSRLSYTSPSSTKNMDMQFEADYYGLEGAKGALSGRPNSSENLTDSAWNLQDGSFKLAQNTAQLVSWKFLARDGDPDFIPNVTVLHRARGVVSDLALSQDKIAEVRIHSTHNGQIHTRSFKWEQLKDVKGNTSWQLKNSQDDFVEIFRVNDSNIRFKITPDSLLQANREATEFFKSRKNNTGSLQLSANILDTDTVKDQIKNLQQIVDSDASETIKIDAKRQAIIYLARFYEHQASLLQSLRQEHLFRAEIKRNDARKHERHAWLAGRKIGVLLQKANKEGFKLEDKNLIIKTDLLNPPDWTISRIHEELSSYKVAKSASNINEDGLKAEYARLRGEQEAFEKEASILRSEAKKLTEMPGHTDENSSPKNRTNLDKEIQKNYTMALHFWSEYIYRTEGLKEDARKLGENGIDGNVPPPDPYLTEILLRQAWIYRQMGNKDRAISTFYDVLTGATKQKINNLTRFERIALLARSQIANSYYEGAKDKEDIEEAIDLYSRLLRSNANELNKSQVELKLLRALFKADAHARYEVRQLERNLRHKIKRMSEEEKKFANEQLESIKALNKEQAHEARKKLDGEIAKIEQSRTKNWKLLKNHTEQFVEHYTQMEPNLRYDGEIRYYKIMANKALDNRQHVQRDMEILLEDASTPEELQKAWLATRVRIIIDVSNLLYTEAIEREKAKLLDAGQNDLKHALSEYLKQAIMGYSYGLEYDQTYQSQILLRQQIGFCQERLGENTKAINTYEEIKYLCDMHPEDLNPTLKVVKMMADLKHKNLSNERENRNRAKEQDTPPSI